jgi:FixJ family two-component response regulator
MFRTSAKQSMPTASVQVYIVDDEPTICTAYARLMRSARMRARTFASVQDFLRSEISAEHACVICDVQMPGLGGLELPALLAEAGQKIPVIFVTAHDTPETRELAQQTGAAGYFRKPVDDQALLDAITWAVRCQPDA